MGRLAVAALRRALPDLLRWRRRAAPAGALPRLRWGSPRRIGPSALGPARSALRPLLATLGAAVCASGCMVENPAYLRDTTGAEVGWSCEYGGCVPVQRSFSPSVPTECGEGTAHLVGAGAIAILCAVSRGPMGEDVVHERTCRPIACRDELDCPQWEERAYACSEGVCVADAGLALDRVDLAALCLFDVPRAVSCPAAEADPETRARMARVEAACEGSRCVVPEGCLAP